MPIVRFKTGSRTGETVALDDNKIVFGRHLSCHCVLNHPTVSREHFFIERTAGKFLVVDNDSGNGTLVNKERITWVELQDGDEIQAGPFVLKYTVSESDEIEEQSLTQHMLNELQAQETAGEQEFDYPVEYVDGIKYFNARRYFEAHEAWEVVWLHSSGDTKLFYQMIIQAAVALYHYDRRNPRGVRGMYSNVLEKLARLPASFMSLDLEDFAQQFKTFFAEIIEGSLENPFDMKKPHPMIELSAGDVVTEDL